MAPRRRGWPVIQATVARFAREITQCTERWMDEGYGECYFRDAANAQLTSDAFMHFQEQRYFTSCYYVMPNHCHVIVKPLGDFELEQILKPVASLDLSRVASRRLVFSRLVGRPFRAVENERSFRAVG